jgi:hypothetical protein
MKDSFGAYRAWCDENDHFVSDKSALFAFAKHIRSKYSDVKAFVADIHEIADDMRIEVNPKDWDSLS